jgi:hypothetical protein
MVASSVSGMLAEREIRMRSAYNLERSASIAALATIATEAMRAAVCETTLKVHLSRTISIACRSDGQQYRAHDRG